jgi:membrane protease YdiL (CAAX protease family)
MAFCLVQQIGLNSLATNRLLSAIDNRVQVALLSGIIFALLHWPNPVLVPVTWVGGFLMSWLFARERNILSLAVWQGILGTVVWWAFPVAWHHAMRVGPGFYRFRLH